MRITGTLPLSVVNSRKPLHEANQGQLNRFFKRRGGADHNHCDLEGKKDNKADHSTKIIPAIIGGIDDEELNAGYQKAQI